MFPKHDRARDDGSRGNGLPEAATLGRRVDARSGLAVGVEGEWLKLPHGKHGLSREFVQSQQRARILRGALIVVAQRGYQQLCIDDVIAVAGVSRRTFYDLYADKEACFLAAYEWVQRSLLDETYAGMRLAARRAWPDRLRALLSGLLDAAADDPAAMQVCLGDVIALGARGLALREQSTRPLAGVVEEAPGAPGGTTVELVVGGVCQVIDSALRQGRAAELPGRVTDLAEWARATATGHGVAIGAGDAR